MNPQHTPDTGWFTRDRLLTVVLALITLIMLYVCYQIVQPFIVALGFALALAVVTQPPYQWLLRRVRKPTATAGIMVAAVAVLLILPLSLLLTYIVQMGIDNLNELRGGVGGWRSALSRFPALLQGFEWVQARFNLEAQLQRIAGIAAGQATGLLTGSVAVLTDLVITLFLLFFLYRDRTAALRALRRLVPLSSKEADSLFQRIGETIYATFLGTITVASLQAVLAGIMYVILRVPGAAIWGSLTFVVALVPVMGTFLVWAPIAVFLALTGHVTKAIILVCWGMFAVGTIDNILYPQLVGNRLRLHTVPTFFAVLGGVALFGPVGIVMGPVSLAITLALLDVWWQRTDDGHSAEEEMQQDSPSSTLR